MNSFSVLCVSMHCNRLFLQRLLSQSLVWLVQGPSSHNYITPHLAIRTMDAVRITWVFAYTLIGISAQCPLARLGWAIPKNHWNPLFQIITFGELDAPWTAQETIAVSEGSAVHGKTGGLRPLRHRPRPSFRPTPTRETEHQMATVALQRVFQWERSEAKMPQRPTSFINLRMVTGS